MLEVWSVYLLRCRDSSLYTGISNNVEKRLIVHQQGNSPTAKYTRSRRPLSLVYQKKIGTRSEATKVELKIKKLTKHKKEALVNGQYSLLDLIK